jgi:ATP synthase I chain
MRIEYIRLAGLQCVITITGTTLTYLVVTPLAAGSVAYGGCIVLVSTLWLSWQLSRGERQEYLGAEICLRHAYRTAIERFVWVLFLLALGFKLLELAPLWLLAGFVAGQSAWLFVPVWKSGKARF